MDKVDNKTLSLLHHTSQFVSLTTSLEVGQKTPPREGIKCKTRKKPQYNAYHSLSFFQFDMERVPKAGEGIINYCKQPAQHNAIFKFHKF